MDPASLEFPLSARRQKHPWLTWLACVVCVVVFAGLLFGMAIGAWVLDRARRPFILAALVLLIIACTITLFWAPWSVSWTSWRGVQDHRNGNFAGAIKWYQRSMALGQEKKWCEDAIEMARTAMQVERFRRRRETTTNENSKLNP